MRTSFLVPLLLCSLLHLAACNGQHGTRTPQASQAVVRDTAQLAEYVVLTYADRYGHLWFGTMNNGVARYDPAAPPRADGGVLTWYTTADGLCGNTIVGMAEDSEGHLWFASHTGLSRYDGKTFTTLLDRETRVMADRTGTIWVGTNNGVLRYDGTALVPFALPYVQAEVSTYSIVRGRASLGLADSKGNLWFITDGAGAVKYDGASFLQYTKKDGLCSNTVMRITEDAEGRIWFACIQAFQPTPTGDGGVCVFDPAAPLQEGGSAFTHFPEVKGLAGNDIYTLDTDRDGHVWIGASGVGAYRYDHSTASAPGGGFTLFDRIDRPDLTNGFGGIQDMVQDRNGTLWFGFSGGLFRFNGTSFVNVTRGGPWR